MIYYKEEVEVLSWRSVTKKLFHMLIDRGITNIQLQKMAGYSANITTRLKNDTYISLESIEKICVVLNCGVDDILEFVPNQPI